MHANAVAASEAPEAAEPVRVLARDVEIQALLDNPASAEEVAALDRAVQDAESALADLLRRQQRIAQALKAMLDRS